MFFFFFFNDTATTEIYTLSLHDALPISGEKCCDLWARGLQLECQKPDFRLIQLRLVQESQSEIGRATSELQSHLNLVCRLLLEKKKKQHRCTCLTRSPNTRQVTHNIATY